MALMPIVPCGEPSLWFIDPLILPMKMVMIFTTNLDLNSASGCYPSHCKWLVEIRYASKMAHNVAWVLQINNAGHGCRLGI